MVATGELRAAFGMLAEDCIGDRGDMLARYNALAEEVSNWRRFLRTEEEEAALEAIRRHGRTARPWGGLRFLRRLEQRLGRPVRRQKPGQKPNAREVLCLAPVRGYVSD